MRGEWIALATSMAIGNPTFYHGSHKIYRGHGHNFFNLDGDFAVEDIGYTPTKSKLLRKLYLHEESHEAAQDQWRERVRKGKYGSVGFTCYNHILKDHSKTIDQDRKGLKASVMGPCLQSVVLTIAPRGQAWVDVFYRTTEVFKKFPADLVFLRDVLLAPFDQVPFISMRCHFANATINPLYVATIMPWLDDPVVFLRRLERHDPKFAHSTRRTMAGYLLEEHQVKMEKFAQARSTGAALRRQLDDDRTKRIVSYLREYF